jgi:hypothetical protein
MATKSEDELGRTCNILPTGEIIIRLQNLLEFLNQRENLTDLCKVGGQYYSLYMFLVYLTTH